jgi:5-keto 4-deoxyuronate isomerase
VRLCILLVGRKAAHSLISRILERKRKSIKNVGNERITLLTVNKNWIKIMNKNAAYFVAGSVLLL